jgi:uncharacterized protein (DUF433 family)
MGKASISELGRALYTIGEAARLLGVPSSRLRRWLEGAKIAGVAYPPVIRPEPTGSRSVTWAEFVEAGFLDQYRSQRVPLQRLRPVIARLRDELGVPYPLAHFKPLIDTASRQLVLRIQSDLDLDDELVLVRLHDGQLQWSQPVEDFLEHVEFDAHAIAQRWRPLGRRAPVVIDPRVAFGIPQIRGIRTEAIAEAYAAGGLKEALRGWDLTEAEVEAAVRMELRRQAA